MINIFKRNDELRLFLDKNDSANGCLADTGFLYALAYTDDRLHKKANEVFDLLADFEVPIYTNVISRMEFIDLIFRKQVTTGAIQLFEEIKNKHDIDTKPLFNLLKFCK